jgi:hypothetical protein
MVKNTEDNIRRLRPDRAWTEQEAFDWLLEHIRREGRVEVASITALGRTWSWEQSRGSKALTRWERAGHIVREQGAGGKIVIRVPGHERHEQEPERQERGQEQSIVSAQELGVHAAVPGVPAHVPAAVPAPMEQPVERWGRAIRAVALVCRYAAAGIVGAVGIGLSAIGMVETATYSLAVGGVLFCAKAIGADALTLTMPTTIRALWRRRSPLVVVAGLMWCVGGVVTVSNIAGYVAEHVEQYQVGRETGATERSMAMERLARLREERKAISETRPPAAIVAAINNARRSEQPALREALAMAKRRDAVDAELAAFEKRLAEIPRVATADASAAVLSEISGTVISEAELRRFRLALLLGLPLAGGFVFSLAFALAAPRTR